MNDFSLYHHGIKGQKWGVQHGPPYPLDYEKHSRREYQENKGSFSSEDLSDRIDSYKAKRALKKQRSKDIRRTMAKNIWRDRNQILKDEVKGALGTAAYNYGSKAASALVARAGWTIAYKNRNIDLSYIGSNIIDKTRPIVLGILATKEVADKFIMMRNYYREASEEVDKKRR